MKNAVEILRKFINLQIRGKHTISYVRVQSVDENRRAEVSLKSDDKVVIDNVPVASVWARDGAGVVIPVQRGDEGLVLHPKEPLEKQIQQRGAQDVGSERRFQLESAVFLPMMWTDEDSVPDHDPDELVVKHDSGTELRLNDEGVHIEPELFVDGVAFSEHTHDYSWTDEGGDGTTDEPNS